jgi:hypothetical protein
LNLPIEALRIIEESSSSPEEMQTKMGYVDECGNPSNNACVINIFTNPLPRSQHLQTSAPELLKSMNVAKRKHLA